LTLCQLLAQSRSNELDARLSAFDPEADIEKLQAPSALQRRELERDGRDRIGESAPSIPQILTELHYDVKTIDIVAGHVAGLLVIDKGVERLALVGPHQ
jgi:hypothetical protein